MTLFDPMEPFALLESFAPAFLESIRNPGSIKAIETVASLVGENGETVAAAGQYSNPIVAIVPVRGTLSTDGRYGGTSTDALRRLVAKLDAEPNVSTIILDIKSPGGTVTGTMEAADAIRVVRDRGETHVVSVANEMMASAATWIGTAANEVYVTPSGEAGSIGVISMYVDWSKAYESMGVKVDVMRTPAKKARFSGIEPLSDEMRETLLTRIGSSYELFKRAMADNRKVRIDTVESRFGGGEMLSAKEAVDAGLVDKIATLDDVVAMATRKQKKPMSSSYAKASLALLDL